MNSAGYQINPRLNKAASAETYRTQGCLRIANFLIPRDVERLYQHLYSKVAWRTYMIANEEQYVTSAAADSPATAAEREEMLRLAHEGMSNGFASLFDADRLLSDDIEDAGLQEAAPSQDVVLDLIDSAGFMELCREVTGISELIWADGQCVRFNPGHFVAYHGALATSERAGKRRVSYALNLTPHWQPEWGGQLQFRGAHGCIIGLQPCFNALDLYAFPRGHWIGMVAPFAGIARYAITGHLYVDGR